MRSDFFSYFRAFSRPGAAARRISPLLAAFSACLGPWSSAQASGSSCPVDTAPLRALDVTLGFTPGIYSSLSNVPSSSSYLSSITLFGVPGTITNQGTWNMNATAWPGAGYYSALTSTITTSNVCSGNSVFGAAAIATCQVGTTVSPAGPGNVLSGRDAWDATGTRFTGTMVNRGSMDLSAALPGAGYYTFPTNPPTASQIVSGFTILGLSGTSVGVFGANLSSLEHRDPATAPVTLYTEAVTNAAVPYANTTPYGASQGYRAVPDINKDRDTNGTSVNRTGWTNTCDGATGAAGGTANSACKCGLSGTITQRIADCAAHGVIGANATWDGTTRANAGQTVWKLVTRTGNPSGGMAREVWQDQRTLQLWSSLVSTSINWCKASGSNNIAGNPTAQVDPNGGHCSNAANQNTAGLAISACFEDGGVKFTSADAAIDTGGKAGLGLSSTPVVAWRMATKYDYFAADIDGLRFILPDGISAEWAGTLVGTNPFQGLTFSATTGEMLNSYLKSNTTPGVRCVGR